MSRSFSEKKFRALNGHRADHLRDAGQNSLPLCYGSLVMSKLVRTSAMQVLLHRTTVCMSLADHKSSIAQWQSVPPGIWKVTLLL